MSPASARHWRRIAPTLPTYRAHNEQAMALAAIGYAKAMHRRRMMACTTSIGPGATNMITAAAVAHVDRLPVLLLPGDVFASRRPDPVLQQVESFRRRHGIRQRLLPPGIALLRPDHATGADPRRTAARAVGADRSGGVRTGDAGAVPGRAGGSIRLPGTVLRPRDWHVRRLRPDDAELAAAAELLRGAKAPLIIAGGGVHYSEATEALDHFATAHGIPVAETQAGKSALPHDHPLNLGAIGVTGTSAANEAAEAADVILAVGTRLQDFTTGSWALFQQSRRAG